jgi:hypothetical protein
LALWVILVPWATRATGVGLAAGFVRVGEGFRLGRRLALDLANLIV